jgi:hypothetical protein
VSVLPGLVYAQPYTPPIRPPVDPGRMAFGLRIVPEDESLPAWQLTDGEDAGIILMRGVRGLGTPQHTSFEEEYASADGAYHFGDRTSPREVFLPVYLFHDGSSQEWVERDSLFWKTLRRGAYSRLYVQLPDGAIRSLRVRYTGGGDEAFEMDPAFFGWAKYGIYMKAPQPFWEGGEVEKEWAPSDSDPMFGSESTAPYLSTSYPTLASATISNPGDMPCSPRVTYTGPIPAGAEVTLGGKTIPIPFEIPDGSILVVDHAPGEQSAVMNGTVDVTEDLGSFDFTEIEPGQSIPVGIELPVGSEGAIAVSITPLYERAW